MQKHSVINVLTMLFIVLVLSPLEASSQTSLNSSQFYNVKRDNDYFVVSITSVFNDEAEKRHTKRLVESVLYYWMLKADKQLKSISVENSTLVESGTFNGGLKMSFRIKEDSVKRSYNDDNLVSFDTLTKELEAIESRGELDKLSIDHARQIALLLHDLDKYEYYVDLLLDYENY